MKELAAKNPEVRFQGNYYIAVPEEWFTELLRQHYGGPVALDDYPCAARGEALAA